MSSTTGRLGPTRTIAAAVAVVMALYHLYVIVPPLDFISPSLREVFRGPPTEFFFRGGHLLFALVLTFLWFRRASPNEEDLAAMLPDERQRVLDANRNGTIVDWCLVALSVLTIVYVFWNYDYIINRIIYVDDPHWMDMVLCVVLVCLLLEATRRLMGLALPITALGFLAYAFIFAKVSPTGLVDQLYLSTEGIFGQPLAVSAAYVMIFVLFGAFMEKTGTGQLFMDFAMSLTGHTAGGPGKVSVVSSSLFGTISGSAVANVMVDGPISIPLMKRTGFPAHFAAAVEAVASTGGQIMPPIMGAAAFVMAEFLGVGYGQVVIWALIPSVLYYLACFGAVHFEAKRLGIVGVPRSELPVLTRVLAERGHLFLPVIILLTIMYAGYSSPLAALAGTLLCFPVAYLRASTRPNVTFKNFIEALIDGSRNTLAVGAGVRLRRCHHRHRHADRSRHRVLAVGGRLVAEHAAAGAGADDDGGDRAGHGHADDASVHHHGIAAGARDHQARRAEARRSHVRVLFRHPLRDHAPGGARRLRRLRARQIRCLGHRLGGDEDRCRRLHRSVHVRLRAGAADDRHVAAGDPGGDHRVDRNPVPGGRSARISDRAGQLDPESSAHRVLLLPRQSEPAGGHPAAGLSRGGSRRARPRARRRGGALAARHPQGSGGASRLIERRRSDLGAVVSAGGGADACCAAASTVRSGCPSPGRHGPCGHPRASRT